MRSISPFSRFTLLPVGIFFLALSSSAFAGVDEGTQSESAAIARRDAGIRKASVGIAQREVMTKLELGSETSFVATHLVSEHFSRGTREYFYSIKLCKSGPCDDANTFEVLVHEKSSVIPFNPSSAQNEFLRPQNVAVYLNSASAALR